jgi:2-keto-4-pentenoate hydratase/2-oxohepta-3-ene-1,7-dioic acid hydratase in catechol pathway
MRLYTTNLGIAKDTEQGDLALLDLPFTDIGELLRSDPKLESVKMAAVTRVLSFDEVTLLAPVTMPSKVLCMGANYHSHLDKEVSKILSQVGSEAEIAALKETPFFFSVPSSAITGPNDTIPLPKIAPDKVDYEVELVLIIGEGGKNISEADAWQHIAGISLANDVSARDIQAQVMASKTMELAYSKGLDGFKPFGPCMLTRDSIELPLDILIETRVNGELRQSESSTGMIHGVERAIAYISSYFSLFPGDIILTGSPAGVGFFENKFLNVGDEIEMTAVGIGTLRNPIALSND